jgi:hypothetical protein
MTKIELTPKLMVYTALLLLLFSVHLFSRVWALHGAICGRRSDF